MKIIDKNGKPLEKGSRVRTGTTASSDTFYPGTVFMICVTADYREPQIHIFYDHGAVNNFNCWETITGVYQAEEVELINE